eukprot:jgi/Ulvmu1/792/UM010_0166.1
MLLLVFAVGGFVAGAAATRRHKKKLEAIEAGTKASIARKMLMDSRRSLVIGHTIVRMQLSRAFISTSRRYAPVPLTFTHAVLESYIPVLATATGGTLIVVTFCRLAIGRLRRRQPSGRAGSSREVTLTDRERADDRENVVVSAIEAAAGLALYSAGKRAWAAGPLRGGLNVFGAAPDLDRCASRERYLAEKLAEFGEALTGGAVSLASLSHLEISRDNVDAAVLCMVKYAKKAVGVQGVLVSPEFGEAWSEFATKVTSHGKEMKRISDGVYYPNVHGVNSLDSHAVLKVVNMTDPVVKFARASRDTGAVLTELVRELGGTRAGWVLSMLSSSLLGACLGAEAAMQLL